MRHKPGRIPDSTADLALGDVSGELVRTAVEQRIADEKDRKLILAHLALGVDLVDLERWLGASRSELTARIEAIVPVLREDPELVALLDGIRRAGRPEHHQELAYQLGLQDWFCAYCGTFIAQPRTGRPRITCSKECRDKRWADQRKGFPAASETAPRKPPPTREIPYYKLARLIPPPVISNPNSALRPSQHPDTVTRNRALLLLGLRCPIPLSATDVAALDIDDVSRGSGGLEVRLFRHQSGGTRYVTIPADVNQELCPLTAVSAWRLMLIRTGRTTGPLFIDMGAEGQLTGNVERLSGTDIARIITAIARSRYRDKMPALRTSTLIPDYVS